MELVRLFWRELCTDLFRSKNEISPEFSSGWISVPVVTWLEVRQLFWQREMFLNTHISHSLWPSELSSLCSEKGDNKIPTDIWLREWFSSLFLKVVTWGVCLLACPVWNTIDCCRAVKWGISFKIMTVCDLIFLLLLSYRSITSFTPVLIFFIMMVILNQFIPLYFGRSFTWGAWYAALALLSSLTGRG